MNNVQEYAENIVTNWDIWALNYDNKSDHWQIKGGKEERKIQNNVTLLNQIATQLKEFQNLFANKKYS